MGAHSTFTTSIHRTFDASRLNAIANLPEVFPHLECPGDSIDLTAIAGNPSNFVLEGADGGFVLIQHEPGRYEVHSVFKPGCGARTIKAMREAMDWMFTRTDALSIVSKIPDGNDRAKGFAIAGGLRSIFRGPTADFVEITALDWAMRTSALEAHGERFHNLLLAAKIAAGSARPVHEHDPAHERAVGAALLMIERGQPVKGVAFYNRWARIAGYAPITLISTAPVTIDAVDAVVAMGAHGMEVLLCR